MRIPASSVAEYISKIPEERQAAFEQLMAIFRTHLPEGFEEGLGYGMPAFIVPHSIYPDGYHCKPSEPLPFVSFASQKNFIALYHMGIYAIPELYRWWTEEFPKHSSKKLDMGKSCVRFKKPEDIPFELIEELAQKVTVQQWIELADGAMYTEKRQRHESATAT